MKILSSTAEYKEFVAYSEDSAGITYMPPTPTAVGAGGAGPDAARKPPPPRAAWTGALGGSVGGPAERAVRGGAKEADYWVPSDAYAIGNEWRHANAPSVPMEQFAELLLRLNRVWKVTPPPRLPGTDPPRPRTRGRRARRSGSSGRRRRSAVKSPTSAGASRTRRRTRRCSTRARCDLGEYLGEYLGESAERSPRRAQVDRLKRELHSLRSTFSSGRRRLNETEVR